METFNEERSQERRIKKPRAARKKLKDGVKSLKMGKWLRNRFQMRNIKEREKTEMGVLKSEDWH